MRMKIAAFVIGGLIAPAVSLCGTSARSQDIISDDFAAPYLQRIEGITPEAGNAKEFNAATHVIDPWPRHAARRKIPANGERMVGAVERYRDVRKLPLMPPPISPVAIGTSGVSSGTGATGSSASGSPSR